MMKYLNFNLRSLDLRRNAIDNEGATTIANSLINIDRLWALRLHNNPIDRSAQDVFSNILCSASNINNTHTHPIIHFKL